MLVLLRLGCHRLTSVKGMNAHDRRDNAYSRYKHTHTHICTHVRMRAYAQNTRCSLIKLDVMVRDLMQDIRFPVFHRLSNRPNVPVLPSLRVGAGIRCVICSPVFLAVGCSHRMKERLRGRSRAPPPLTSLHKSLRCLHTCNPDCAGPTCHISSRSGLHSQAKGVNEK